MSEITRACTTCGWGVKGLGESVAVVLRYSVYENEILDQWTERERERYHDADPVAREQFAKQAQSIAEVGGGAPDVEVYIDGSLIWSNQ